MLWASLDSLIEGVMLKGTKHLGFMETYRVEMFHFFLVKVHLFLQGLYIFAPLLSKSFYIFLGKGKSVSCKLDIIS